MWSADLSGKAFLDVRTPAWIRHQRVRLRPLAGHLGLPVRQRRPTPSTAVAHRSVAAHFPRHRAGGAADRPSDSERQARWAARLSRSLPRTLLRHGAGTSDDQPSAAVAGSPDLLPVDAGPLNTSMDGMLRRPVESVLVCSRLAAAREPSARQRRTAASNAATAIANRIVNRSSSPRRLDLTSQTARTSSCALPRVRAQGGIVTSEARTLKPRREALLWRRGRGSHEPRPDNGITIVVRERVHQSARQIAPVMARSRSAISRESRRTTTSRGWMSHTADRTSAARRAPPRKGKQGV